MHNGLEEIHTKMWAHTKHEVTSKLPLCFWNAGQLPWQSRLLLWFLSAVRGYFAPIFRVIIDFFSLIKSQGLFLNKILHMLLKNGNFFLVLTYQICAAFSTSSTSFSNDLHTPFFKELQKNQRFFFVEKCHFVPVQFPSATKCELEIFGQRFSVLNTQWTINRELDFLLGSIGITGKKK